MGGNDAPNLVLALEQPGRGTGVVLAIVRFVRLIAAVVLLVAFPPEGNAFVGFVANELRGRAVGQAGLLIISEMEILRTSAHAFPVRRQQAEIRAAAVVLTRIRLVQRLLSGAVKNLQIHGPMDHGGDVDAVSSVEFVRLDDGLELPVGPIHVILEHGEGEDVRQVRGKDDASIASFQIGHHEKVLPRVAPKQMLGDVTDGQGVGPTNVLRHDVRAVCSVLGRGGP